MDVLPDASAPRAAEEAALTQAIAALQASRPDTAKSLLAAALRRAPESADLIHYLGLAECRLGNVGPGLALLAKSLRLRPDDAGFVEHLSAELQRQGRLREAADYLRRALALNPGSPDLCIRLGELCQQLGRDAEAEACFTSALQADRHAAHAALRLARALKARFRRLDALRVLERCFDSRSDDFELLLEYCDSLIESGQPRLAADHLTAALRGGRAESRLWALLGRAQSVLGEFDSARLSLRKSIEGDDPYTSSMVALTTITRFVAGDPLIASMQAMLAATADGSIDRLNVHFALGKALDDTADYPAAFQHYRQGNRIASRYRPFQAEQHARFIDAMMRHFDRSRVHQAVAPAAGPVLPIFILGMPRSGSTLCERVLAAHPAVAAGGEAAVLSHELLHAVGPENIARPEGLAQLDGERLSRVRRNYLERMSELAGGRACVTDKLPGNFMRIGLLHLLFPEAPILHCRRHALDTCLSCYFTLFHEGHEFSYALAALAEYYRAYLRIMRHWHECLPPGRLLDVHYEDLVLRPEATISAILAYCRLPYDERCRNFQQFTGTVGTASVYQARQPLYRSSIGRWRHYRQELAGLQAALQA